MLWIPHWVLFSFPTTAAPPAFKLTQQPYVYHVLRAYQKESFLISLIHVIVTILLLTMYGFFNTKRLHQCVMVNAFMYSRRKVNKEGCKKALLWNVEWYDAICGDNENVLVRLL